MKKVKNKGFDPKREWWGVIDDFLKTSDKLNHIEYLKRCIVSYKKEIISLEKLLEYSQEDLKKHISKNELTPLKGYYREQYFDKPV